MKKTAKYLVYMLTVVLIASVIGVAFAWYSSNTTVTATGSATAAQTENVDISFTFKEGDNETDRIYLSTAQLISDYYNRDKYSGEEGWSEALDAMVGNGTQDGNTYLRDPNVRADQIDNLSEYLGTRDHVFTLYYYIEIKGEGETSFGLNLNSVKIYKNGVTLRDKDGNEVGNSHVEYPVVIGEEGNEQPAGDGTIAKVTIGSETGNTDCYFDVTQTTVYGTLGEDGSLSDAITGASYSVADCKLTVGGTEYVLSGRHTDRKTDEATGDITEENRYFKNDAEEGVAAGASVENFVFNCYQVEEKPENGKIYNKAHEGDYNLYIKGATGAEERFAEAGQTLKTQSGGDGYIAKLVIAITYFREIEIGEDNKPIGDNEIFPYADKEYMKAHFKFNISAELAK